MSYERKNPENFSMHPDLTPYENLAFAICWTAVFDYIKNHPKIPDPRRNRHKKYPYTLYMDRESILKDMEDSAFWNYFFQMDFSEFAEKYLDKK